MSYCVNCGVELDHSIAHCPMCNTPVINPNELQKLEKAQTFPQESGQVEEVRKHDLGLLISIVLGAIAVSALLINLFVFPGTLWSLLVIGACVILFFLVFPAFIYTKTPIYLSILFDGLSVVLYLYFISLITTSKAWFPGLALPIVGLVTLLLLIFVWLVRTFKVRILTTSFYLFTEIAILCVGLELLIDRFLQKPLHLFWSAVVLMVCAVIDSALITVLSRRRLRDAVRRRLHF